MHLSVERKFDFVFAVSTVNTRGKLSASNGNFRFRGGRYVEAEAGGLELVAKNVILHSSIVVVRFKYIGNAVKLP